MSPQEIYDVEIKVAHRLVPIAVLAGIAALVGLIPAQVGQPILLASSLVVFLAFLVVSLYLRFGAKGPLSFPVDPAWHRGWGKAVTIVFLMVMAYGIVTWPAAPVRPSGSSFVDKNGKAYTQSDYVAFKRWETAYFVFWLPFALYGLTSLPARNNARGAV